MAALGPVALAAGVWVAWPSYRCPVTMPSTYRYLGYTPPPTALAFAEMAQRDPVEAGGGANWLFEAKGPAEDAARSLAAYLSGQGAWRRESYHSTRMHVLKNSDGSCIIAVYPKWDGQGYRSDDEHCVRVNAYWRGPNALERALASLPPPLLKALSGR